MNREALSEVVLFATRRETLRLVREGWDKARLRHVDTVDKSLPRTDLVESCSGIFTKAEGRHRLLNEIRAGVALRRPSQRRDRSDPQLAKDVHIQYTSAQERQQFLAQLRYAASMAVVRNPHRFRRALAALRHVDTVDKTSTPVIENFHEETRPPSPTMAAAVASCRKQRHQDVVSSSMDDAEPIPVQIDGRLGKHKRSGSVAIHVQIWEAQMKKDGGEEDSRHSSHKLDPAFTVTHSTRPKPSKTKEILARMSAVTMPYIRATAKPGKLKAVPA